MAYFLKRLADDQLLSTAELPIWSSGMWSCGDQKVVDPQGTLFAAVQVDVPPTVTAARAYNLFPIQTRIDIKASDDPLVKEMLAGLQVEITAGGEVDLGSTSIQEGLQYLVTMNVSPQPVSGARKYLTQAQANNITANILP